MITRTPLTVNSYGVVPLEVDVDAPGLVVAVALGEVLGDGDTEAEADAVAVGVGVTVGSTVAETSGVGLGCTEV